MVIDQGMGLLAWLIVGGVAGWLASMVMKSNLGLLMDIIVGVVGAFVGGMLFHFLGEPGVVGFSLWSVLVAFIGSVVLLGLIRLLRGQRVVY
jgi:uncharacterized membrane protein YeaQ/YmgE (transglycosylase-associated protein family)